MNKNYCLKTKDLMIGDWVILSSNGKVPDIVCKVEEICADSLYDTVMVTDCDNPISIEEIKPVPLTEEILENNHFNPEYEIIWWKDWWYNKSIFHIECEKGDFVIKTNIKYVHELQHILNMCGIEKEIIV